MALSLDDKLLGEKMHYYCSSSEDEGSEEEVEEGGSNEGKGEESTVTPPIIEPYTGSCTNTGPKGVVNDWRRFRQLEAEKRQEMEVERLALAKKLTLTCQSNLDEEREEQELLEQEMGLLEDEFLQKYREQRIAEMKKSLQVGPKFGELHSLTRENFVEAVDKEEPSVTVIIHLYENKSPACETMNRCLMCLAPEYPMIKFCRITASHLHSASTLLRREFQLCWFTNAASLLEPLFG